MNYRNRFINVCISLFIGFLYIIECKAQGLEPNHQSKDKIDGISLVSSRVPLNQKNIEPIMDIDANYVAVMPFGFVRNLNSPIVYFNSNNQWYGETAEGAKQYVALLKKNNFKIMLKPQIWVSKGQFTGHINMNTEGDWVILEKSYSNFIIEFATLAQKLDIELFCIGTELEQFIVNRPKYWTELIYEIKNIFKGKLTYAANWNEFEKVPFWKHIDYIGIDAYFPLSERKTPTLEEIEKGWQPYKRSIERLQRKFQKPILFTEFGYRSVDFAAHQPWVSTRNLGNVNLEVQSNATKAIFNQFWDEDWFAGGFVWKWFVDHEKSGGLDDNQYSPQNKPVEKLIQQIYEK